jgi:peptidoglycan/LPS O-acetylase OafA/YrhL
MSSADFRADINGLRGLSVALVVAYHLQLRGAGGGFIGVDVFFVVSGYLMTRILLAEDAAASRLAAYGRFVAARVRRIVPALAVLLVLLMAAGTVALPPFDLESLARQASWAASFASNHFYLDHSGYADRSADDLWLLHTWSLSLEWQFYLLYPLLLFALRGARQPALAMSVLVALSLLSLIFQVAQRSAPLESGFFLLGARAWELLMGGLASLALQGRGSKRTRRALSLLGVTLILGSALGLALLRLRPTGLDLVLLGPVIGAALVLWAHDADSPALRWAPLQALGLWSYSIYLWHWPILLALRWTPVWSQHAAVGSLLVALLSLLAGAASYRWIERPWLGRAPSVRCPAGAMWRVSAPLALLGVSAVCAFGITVTQGLAWRDREPPPFGSPASYHAAIAPLMFPDARCSNFKRRAEEMVVCGIERGAGRRVLVIGDSHAGHLWPWFVRHSRVSVDFLQASECPPVPHFERLQPGYRCKDYAARAWNLAQEPVYDTVIVSARWSTVGGAGPSYCHGAGMGRCESVRGERKAALVRAELQGAIERVLAAGKTVVLLDSAPEATTRVPSRLAREWFWYGRPRLTIERAAVESANAWIEPMLDGLRAQRGFRRVSLRERLCDEHRCRVYDDTLKRPVYFDASHFDPVWIAENAGFFEPFVRRAAPAHLPAS